MHIRKLSPLADQQLQQGPQAGALGCDQALQFDVRCDAGDTQGELLPGLQGQTAVGANLVPAQFQQGRIAVTAQNRRLNNLAGAQIEGRFLIRAGQGRSRTGWVDGQGSSRNFHHGIFSADKAGFLNLIETGKIDLETLKHL